MRCTVGIWKHEETDRKLEVVTERIHDSGYFLPLVIAPDCANGGLGLLTNSLMSRVISYYLLPYRTDPLLETKIQNKKLVDNIGTQIIAFWNRNIVCPKTRLL